MNTKDYSDGYAAMLDHLVDRFPLVNPYDKDNLMLPAESRDQAWVDWEAGAEDCYDNYMDNIQYDGQYYGYCVDEDAEEFDK